MSSQNHIEQSFAHIRSLSEKDFKRVCEKLVHSLRVDEKEAERIPTLRQLLLLIKHSKHSRVPQGAVDALSQALLSPTKSKRIKALCGLVLQELVPEITLDLPVEATHLDEAQIPNMLGIAMLQSCYDEVVLRRLASQLVKWISTVGLHVDILSSSLCGVLTVQKIKPKIFSPEQKHIITCQMLDWLKKASLYQANNPYSRGIFKKEGSEELVSELDGTPAKDFFTILCLAQHFRGNQLLNVYTFSLLRQWLVQNSNHEEKKLEEADATLEATVQYALRVMEQCNRKTKGQHDENLQQAALIEAICQLDCVCLDNPTYIPKVFEEIKSVSSKLSTSQPRVMVPLMQFFLNHSESVVHDAFHVYSAFFDGVLDAHYASPALAFDAIMFIRKNLSVLCHRTSLLQKFFPNILKIFAWSPQTYISDMVDILPSFLSPSTSLEMVHALLDLPCLTAALEMKHQRALASPAASTTAFRAERPAAAQVEAALEKLTDQRYIPLFKFILRKQSGFGDTIDRLSLLHSVLEGLKSHPRVVMCAEAVPVLLKLAFRVILEEGARDLAGSLVPVLLERSGLLYGLESFQNDVRRVLSSQLVAIFRKYPHLVMDQFSDLLDFVGSIRNITGREQFFVRVVWVIGEYLSASYDPRCKPENIAAMYEALEALSYETSGIVQASAISGSTTRGSGTSGPTTRGAEPTTYSPSLLTALMSAVAKLASRSQDLIPRVMLCLTKLGQVGHVVSALDDVSRNTLTQRSNELLNLMKLPHIAAVVLNPPTDIDSGCWHRDNLALPVLLQTTSEVLQGKS